jgi:hypothetical protein
MRGANKKHWETPKRDSQKSIWDYLDEKPFHSGEWNNWGHADWCSVLVCICQDDEEEFIF